MVPTARHQYNLRPKQQLAYSCTQTVTFSLSTNFITAMEANAVVHPVTRVSQEYRHFITGYENPPGRDISPINWGNLPNLSGL